MTLALARFVIAAGFVGLVALAFETNELGALGGAAIEIAYAGSFASGLAFSLQAIGQRYTTAPQAAIFLSAEAPMAAIFRALVLSERLGWLGGLGCCLILAAMLPVEVVPAKQSGSDDPADVDIEAAAS